VGGVVGGVVGGAVEGEVGGEVGGDVGGDAGGAGVALAIQSGEARPCMLLEPVFAVCML